ncbi:MAG: carbamoyltransferase C-terminal domain-containing protein [Candidatus Aenigmarchaeota archaeon]|nr:carbamoyltransferase C-terminal domain-containing protein [Candidatus Aenigmarchaeota archaeon]
MNVASSLQAITEDVILKMVKYAKKITGSKSLCMAGGVALNSVANGRIILERIFENCFFQPAATDADGALGSALFAFNSIFNNERKYIMEHAFLGPEFDSNYIKNFLGMNNIEYEKLSKKEITGFTAEKIAKNKVIGWFQGRMELGPRALGHRSILANPSNPKMRDILNEKVKKREWFRPFAPSLDIDFMETYFNIVQDFPFMIVTLPVKKGKVKEMNKIKENLRKKYPELSDVQLTIMSQEKQWEKIEGEPFNEVWGPAEEPMTELVEISKKNNIKVILTIYQGKFNEEVTVLKGFARQHDWISVPLFGEIYSDYSHSDLILHPKDEHPSALGHRLIAEAIYKELEVKQVVE